MPDGKNVENSFDSIVGDLFYGELDEKKLFPYPGFSSSQKEMSKEMCDAISKFGDERIDSVKMDEEATIPESVYKELSELGLYGLAVPEKFGGMELDYSLYSRVFAQVASYDGSLATMLGAHQSIGYRALLMFGTDEQKNKWLPKLASGEWIAAFCLTEPGSGSDAYSIKTKAKDNKDGTFTINGQKIWITNGGIAHFYTVFCKTDHEVDGKKIEKITAFAVEKNSEGLTFGAKENKMGIRASETRAVYFDNVKVDNKNIIGELGKGFKVAMKVLNSGRLSLGAGCVGGMKTVLKLTTDQASNRKQFNKTLTEFGLIQEKLANMAAKTYAAESTIYMTTGNMCRGMKDFYLETAVCKIVGSEYLWDVVDQALQIAAGSGYMKEYPYERIMRDSRINLIFEGTNEILRCFLALSGMSGPSEKLKELGKIADVSQALKDPIKSLGVLTDFAKSRISKMIGSVAITMHDEELKEETAQITSMISAFSIQVENILIKYGKKIIDHELPQKRLANMVMDIYVSLCTLSRTTQIRKNDDVPQEKKDYVLKLAKLAITNNYYDFKSNLKGIDKNQDKNIASITKDVVNFGGYGLDIIDY
jgi:acyl-CoA dehydrogenase family protein 9